MEASATTATDSSPKVGEDQLRRLRRAEVLLNVYQRTAALENLDDVLAAIVEIATRETKCEAGTLFLHDDQTGELYSRIVRGGYTREIRIQNTRGVAGHVFSAGHGINIPDAYQDERFDASIDEQTGFVTKNILCAPVKTVKGEVIGVIQTLNRIEGSFNVDDLELLEAVATQASVALQSTRVIERMKKTRAQELKFLEIVSEITSEIELSTLLQKVMDEATKMLNAERGTLFLNDEKTNELFSLVGGGLQQVSIRFPNDRGIAGAVFTSAHSVHIPYAYADLRFNPAFDRTTGFFTRSILCVPIVTKKGKIIGVTQVLNKKGGTFTQEDESRLRAFTAQVSIALENAKLFDDVQNMKNYNESMLESITNGVITLDEDGKIKTCNAAGFRILGLQPKEVIGQKSKDFFAGPNAPMLALVEKVESTQDADSLLNADLAFGTRKLSVNLTVQPLVSSEGKKLGTVIMIEDISDKKRLQSTLSRKLDPRVVEQLLQQGEDVLGGASGTATVLFSDIRGFTTLTEELGAQGTVSLLNEYFTVMVECILREEGYLDKFIGDAIMAAFGVPLPHADDEDRAVRAAISMLTDLGRWNADRISRGLKPVHIGIGLNTDTVVSGNIGTAKRNDYTLIGDGVNLAARLESACKQYGTKILISENTFRKLKGTYRTREVDRVVVKGKTEPVAVFEVLDFHDEKSFPHMSEVLGLFKDGALSYRSQNWDRGISSFKEAMRLHPDDGVSKHYVARCEYLKANPPGADWDGTWHMHEK